MSKDLVQIEKHLSIERFRTYRIASGGNIKEAFELYEWNISLSGALFEAIAIVEVIVRNEIDRNLTLWASSKSSDWVDILPLDERGQADIAKARARSSKNPIHGKFVAELNFGFWRFLLANRYLHSIWLPMMNEAFPNLKGSEGMRREAIERCMQKLWFLRNRIGHHEPIFNRNIAEDLDAMDCLLGWVSHKARDWALDLRRIDEILLARPI